MLSNLYNTFLLPYTTDIIFGNTNDIDDTITLYHMLNRKISSKDIDIISKRYSHQDGYIYFVTNADITNICGYVSTKINSMMYETKIPVSSIDLSNNISHRLHGIVSRTSSTTYEVHTHSYNNRLSDLKNYNGTLEFINKRNEVILSHNYMDNLISKVDIINGNNLGITFKPEILKILESHIKQHRAQIIYVQLYGNTIAKIPLNILLKRYINIDITAMCDDYIEKLRDTKTEIEENLNHGTLNITEKQQAHKEIKWINEDIIHTIKNRDANYTRVKYKIKQSLLNPTKPLMYMNTINGQRKNDNRKNLFMQLMTIIIILCLLILLLLLKKRKMMYAMLIIAYLTLLYEFKYMGYIMLLPILLTICADLLNNNNIHYSLITLSLLTYMFISAMNLPYTYTVTALHSVCYSIISMICISINI